MAEQPVKHPENVNGRVYLPDLFRYIEQESDRSKQVSAIQAYIAKDQSHRTVLQRVAHIAFGQDRQMDLPEGKPPFRPNQAPDYPLAGRTLFKTIRQVERFIPDMEGFVADRNKRERLFISILESMHEFEAEILVAMKDKNLDAYYPSVTADLLKEADERLVPADAPKAQKEDQTSDTPTSSSTGTSGSSTSAKKSSTRSGTTTKKSGTQSKTTSKPRQKSTGQTKANGSTGGNNTKES